MVLPAGPSEGGGKAARRGKGERPEQPRKRLGVVHACELPARAVGVGLEFGRHSLHYLVADAS